MRPVNWVGPSRDEVHALPPDVEDMVGYALYLAQLGEKHPDAKPLSGFGNAQIIEIVADHEGNAYRAVYALKFPDAIYVLCAFQKKSTHGKRTPQRWMELVRSRLRQAAEAAKETT